MFTINIQRLYLIYNSLGKSDSSCIIQALELSLFFINTLPSLNHTNLNTLSFENILAL